MEQKNQSFTELDVWKKARILKNELKDLTAKFPPEEKFRLADQLIRSSRSITANISEGHVRFTYKEQLHFCIQARGSLSETRNHLRMASIGGIFQKPNWTTIKTWQMKPAGF